MLLRRHRPAGRVPAGRGAVRARVRRTWPPPPTPCPACCRTAPVALEGMDARLVDVVRRRRGRVRGARPAARRRVAVRRDGRRHRGRGPRRRGEAGRRRRLPGRRRRHRRAGRGRCGASARTAPGSGGRTPAGAPAWPGWEDAAVPPERLGAYLREFDALMREHGLDGLVYGHFGDGCVHVRIDFPFSTATPTVFREFVTATAARWSAGTAARCPASTATAARAASCCRTCTRPRPSRLFGAVKHVFDPANLLNPGVIVDPAPVDADLRVPAAHARCARNLGFAYPHDGGDLSTAVHRCVGVGKCRADTTVGGGVMCPSYLATRDEKDSTRGRARVLQELANGTLVGGLRRAGGAGVARPVPVLQGLLVRLPGRRRHGHLQGRGAAPALPAPAAAGRRTTRWAGCRAGPAWPSRTPRLANATLRSRRARRAGQAARRHRRPARRCRASPSRPSAPGSPARPTAPRHAGAAVGRHLHRPLHPRGRAGRGARARGGRLRGPAHRPSRCAAG